MINPFNYSSIVILTGAGISAESGLKTFRDSGGLWEGHKVEDVATPEAFARRPSVVYDFYNKRRKQLLNDASPNTAHKALAQFEMDFRGDFTLVTQNVDNLHEQAGNTSVIHMHGELLKARCLSCERIFDIGSDINSETQCQYCQLNGNVRPHIVWFGEIPLYMDTIESALRNCDLFISVGTSGNVYPAAGFVHLATACGADSVELNLEPSHTHSQFHHSHHGPATELLPPFFAKSRDTEEKPTMDGRPI